MFTTVRGGSAITVASQNANLDDYEFGAGINTTYRVTGKTAAGNSNSLTVNQASLETDTAGWATQTNATITRTTAQALHGTASLQLSSVAAGDMAADTQPTKTLVSASTQYTAAASFRTAVSARSVTCRIRWYTSADVFISESVGTAQTDGTGGWTQAVVTATSPGTAAKAAVAGHVAATGAASEVHYLDQAGLWAGASTSWVLPPQTVTVNQDLTDVWLKVVARPFLNRTVVVADKGPIGRLARGGVFDVVGRSFPVAVSDVRASKRYTLQVLTDTPAKQRDLDLLLASGEPVFVHVPSANTRVPAGYFVIGDTAEAPTLRRSDRRLFDLPLVEVAAPGPDVVGSAGTWQTVLNTYTTWLAVLDAHATWSSLLELIGSPTEVIVP